MTEITTTEEMLACNEAIRQNVRQFTATSWDEEAEADHAVLRQLWIAGRDYQRAQAATDAEGEVTRLREIVKGAWRFWAALVFDPPLTIDRGYSVIRVRKDQVDEFDAIFRVSKALTPAHPAGSEERDDG